MKAQINMVFTFMVALLVIGAIVLVATKMLSGTAKDKCTADMVVFSDKFKEALRTNNDYGGINQETFLSPCNYKTICLVDERVFSDATQNGIFRTSATGFPGDFFIRDSVSYYLDDSNAVKTNIFLINTDGMVLDGGYAPQLELYDPTNVTCITSRQGKFTFVFRGQGRTTLVNAT